MHKKLKANVKRDKRNTKTFEKKQFKHEKHTQKQEHTHVENLKR